MRSVIDWAKANPKAAAGILAVVCTMLGTLTGWQFKVRAAQPGEQTGVIIVLPEDSPNVFGNIVQGEANPRFSETARRALRSAGGVMRERGAEREPFFGMLRDLHETPDSLTRYEAAADKRVSGLDPVTISIAVKIAVKVAIAILERRSTTTGGEWDDRLLKLLKLFELSPFAIPVSPS